MTFCYSNRTLGTRHSKVLEALETFLIRVIAQSKFISLKKSAKSFRIVCFLFFGLSNEEN